MMAPRNPASSMGPVPRQELGELYRAATALVMPSLAETIGLPLVEAMSAGTPVMAADRPYAREVCGKHAMFFEPTDPDAFVAAAARMLTDRPLRDRLGESARRWVRDVSDANAYRRMVAAVTGRALEPQAMVGGKVPIRETRAISG